MAKHYFWAFSLAFLLFGCHSSEITLEIIDRTIVGKTVGEGFSAWRFQSDEPRTITILEQQADGNKVITVVQIETHSDQNKASGKLRLHYNRVGQEWRLQKIDNLDFKLALSGKRVKAVSSKARRAEAMAKTAEAEDNLSKMYRAVVSYYVSRRSFPESTRLTPLKRCCEYPGGRCPPNPNQWNTPTWKALHFSPENHYYQYQFVSNGQAFTARALGDLDCDGVYSTFERAGMINRNGDVEGTRGIFRNLPTE